MLQNTFYEREHIFSETVRLNAALAERDVEAMIVVTHHQTYYDMICHIIIRVHHHTCSGLPKHIIIYTMRKWTLRSECV